MRVKKVLLIRHGQTDFNRQHRLQGVMSVPLNQQGRTQAKALAQHLKSQPIDAIFTSPLPRAKETAQIIGNVLKQPVQCDARIREIAFGCFEGLTYAQAKQQHPQAHRMWDSGYIDYKVPGGESRGDVQRRMMAAWTEVTSSPDMETVVMVTHGSAIKILLGTLYAQLPDTPLMNTSITTLERWRTVWEITSYAARPHLKG